MKSVNRAKLDLIIAVTAFGTIGIFVRYINLPSSVIAFVRGAVGAVFLLLLLYARRYGKDGGKTGKVDPGVHSA